MRIASRPVDRLLPIPILVVILGWLLAFLTRRISRSRSRSGHQRLAQPITLSSCGAHKRSEPVVIIAIIQQGLSRCRSGGWNDRL